MLRRAAVALAVALAAAPSLAACNARVATDQGVLVVSPSGDPQLTLTLGRSTPGASSASPGAQRVVMLQVRASAFFGDVLVRRVTVRANGNLDEVTHVTGVELVLDSNRNGLLDGGDVLLAQGSYSGTGASTGAILDLGAAGGDLNVARDGSADLLVAYSFSPAAPRGQTTSATIDGPDVVAFAAKSGVTVRPSGKIVGSSFVVR